MKTKKDTVAKIYSLAFSLLLMFTSAVKAQETNTAEIKIQTSAVCETCKKTIEQALAFEKGVKKSELDLNTKIVSVVYNPNKTTPEKIRVAISNAGYDADSVKANPKTYKKLEECCKKENSSH
jgi:periplasmic mercuric ion binding protein